MQTMDFHPVILAGGRGSRMYPLSEECPKALLPVGNKPLIWYPVQLLEKHGYTEALVVVRDSQHKAISDVLGSFQSSDGVHLNFTVTTIPDQDDLGTADALRLVRNKVKNDVLLLSCDLVTSVPLHLLTDYHHTHNCTLTSLLVRPSQEEDTRKKTAALGTEKDIIGLADGSRMVFFSSQADLDDQLVVQRSMLRRYPQIHICSTLNDAHLYLLKRWVLDYLQENKSISSVKGELVPHMVRYQSLQSGVTYTSHSRQAMQTAAASSLGDMDLLAYQMSSFAGLHNPSTDRPISCHAVVLEHELCLRVNTIPAYIEANRMLPNHVSDFNLSNSSMRLRGVSSDCLIGSGVQLGDKGSVKRSCVGHHCSIGDKTKIINCVIMDHVHIGEGCTLQSCIVCSHARIEDKVVLKECQVGANFTVIREADLRGETLVVGGGLHF